MNSPTAILSGLMTSFGSAALLLLLTLLALPTHADAQTYTISDIGTLGGVNTFGTDINEQGTIAGEAATGPHHTFHAFVSDEGTLIDLGTLPGGDFSSAGGINSRGQVAGYASVSDSLRHAVIWDTREGTVKDLGTLNGTSSTATDINESGVVVGGIFRLPDGDLTHAFISRRNGTALRDLGTLGGSYSLAWGVNARGQVTGDSTTAGEQSTHAFISARHGGALRDLGTLGGGSSMGFRINNRGQVTGESQLAPDVADVPLVNATVSCLLLPSSLRRLLPPPAIRALVNAGAPCAPSTDVSQSILVPAIHAFVSAPNGGPLMDLGTLGGDLSTGLGINNRGQVVGESYTSPGHAHAFLYSDGQMIDLNTVITGPLASHVELEYAQGINDRGWILAVGLDSRSGNLDTYLLIPMTH